MKRPTRKLEVRRETLRVLEQRELVRVAGGDSELTMCPTTLPRRGFETAPG